MAGSPPPGLTVLYDGDCDVCTRTARRLEHLDRRRRRLRLVPLQDTDPPPGTTRADLERELHAVDRDGAVSAGWEAVVAIAREVPLLAWLPPLSRVPGVSWLGRRWYRRVAARRDCADCVSTRVRSQT